MLFPSSIPWLGLALPLTSAAIFAKPRGQKFQERAPMWIRQASNSTILGTGTGVGTGTGTGAGTTVASIDPGLASTTSCTSESTVTDLVTSNVVESFGPGTTVLVSGGDDCHECETTVTEVFVETLTEGYAPGATIILTPEASPSSGQGAPTVPVIPVPAYGGVPTPVVTTLTIVPAGTPAYSAIIPASGQSSPVFESTESSVAVPVAATPTPFVTVVTIPAYASPSAVPVQSWSTELVIPPSTSVTCSAGSPVTSSGGFYGTTYIVTPAVCETITLPGTTFTVTPTAAGPITLPGTTFTITQETIVVPPASPAASISTPSVVMVPGLGETTFGVPVFGNTPVSAETPIATVTVVIGTITPTPITTVLPSLPVYTGPAVSEASPVSILPVPVVTVTVTEGSPALTQPAAPEVSVPCVTVYISGTPVTIPLPATGGIVSLPATVPAYLPGGGAGSPPAGSNISVSSPAVVIPGNATPASGQTVPETPIATTTITLPPAGAATPSVTVVTLGSASSEDIPASAPVQTVPGNPASAPPSGGAPGASPTASAAGTPGLSVNSPNAPLPTGGASESPIPAPPAPVSGGLPASPNSPVSQVPVITTVVIPASGGVPETVTTVTIPAPAGPAGTPEGGANSESANTPSPSAGEIPTVVTLTEFPSGAVPTVQVSGNVVVPASGSASPVIIVSTLTAVPIPASPAVGGPSSSTVEFAGPGEVVSAPAGPAVESAIVTVITNIPNPATETPEVIQVTIPPGVSVLTATLTATPHAPEIRTFTIPAPAPSPAGSNPGAPPASGSPAGNGTAPASGTGSPSSSGTTGSGSGSEGGSSGSGSGSGTGTYGNATAPATGNGGSSSSGTSGSTPPAPPAAGSPNSSPSPSSATGPIAASSGSKYGVSTVVSVLAMLAALLML